MRKEVPVQGMGNYGQGLHFALDSINKRCASFVSVLLNMDLRVLRYNYLAFAKYLYQNESEFTYLLHGALRNNFRTDFYI